MRGTPRPLGARLATGSPEQRRVRTATGPAPRALSKGQEPRPRYTSATCESRLTHTDVILMEDRRLQVEEVEERRRRRRRRKEEEEEQEEVG